MKFSILVLSLILYCINVSAESDNALIKTDFPRLNTLAIKAILEKYPNIKTDDLVFHDFHYSKTDKNEETIDITYMRPSTAKTEDKSDQEYIKTDTKTETVIVELSNSGEIIKVSKNSWSKSIQKKK
ncbi:MAG TPA: hypothetical protein DCZ94_03685 [Lentisphaeria bacterium]|nr:MAG: hypothetical protein A2X48_02310 [Lentisphaerae bacterium GWF2_49_21]HBC86035.1 hypothetical protein [Lentisphaeria bacterium]